MLSTSISMTFGRYSIHPEKGSEHDMRVSEGVPRGSIGELYNPGMFQDHEEVIVFTRDEFSRTYTSMKEQIDHINNIDLFFNRNEEWKLIGYWPKILASLYLLDRNLDSLLEKKPLQCYLDACLFNTIGSSQRNIAVSKRKVPAQLKLPI